MLLEYAAFLALAAKCAPGIAPEDLASHGTVESGYETLAIHDNTTRQKVPTPRDLSVAVATANELLGAGHSVDVGLMQINAKNFDWLGLSVETSFDACSSIHAAADHLRAVSRYNTGSPTRGFSNGYVAKVLRARYGTDTGIGVAPAKVVPEPAAHDWDVFPDQDEAPGREPTAADTPPALIGGQDVAAKFETNE